MGRYADSPRCRAIKTMNDRVLDQVFQYLFETPGIAYERQLGFDIDRDAVRRFIDAAAHQGDDVVYGVTQNDLSATLAVPVDRNFLE